MVLAGGRSTRLGTDKALLPLLGQNLLDYNVRKLGCIVDDVTVVTSSEACRECEGAPVVRDMLPVKGAIVGVYTALSVCRHRHCLVVAVDMPFLSLRLLDRMASEPRDYDVLIPRTGTGNEPLHAIYSKDCLPVIQRTIDRGSLRIGDCFGELTVRYLDESVIDSIDPGHFSFFNVNTADDLALALSIIDRLGLIASMGRAD